MTFSPDEGFEAHAAFEFRHFGTNLASELTFRSQIAAGAAVTRPSLLSNRRLSAAGIFFCVKARKRACGTMRRTR
jgi:hypothetical protein